MLWVICAGCIFCSPNQQHQCYFFAILSEQISRSIAGHFSLAELSWKFLIVIVDWGFWFSNRSRFCMWNPGVGILTCSLRHVRPRSMAMSCESSFPSLRRRAGSMPWLPAYFWIYNMSTCCVARCRHRSAWAKVTQNVICHVSLSLSSCCCLSTCCKSNFASQ